MDEAIVKIWKGQYGFATLQDGKDVFIHISDLKDNSILYQGQRIKLEVEKTEKGFKGSNVEVVEG